MNRQKNELQPVRQPDSLSGASRLATLLNTGLLDSPIEEAFDRLTSLAARTIRAPVSLVSLVSEERQFFKSVFGLKEPWASQRETPLTHSFCQHVVSTGEPLIILDSRDHPLVKDNLAIRDLGVISYAGFPLTMKNGDVLGSFCVIDSNPRAWTDEEIRMLGDLSLSVMTEIELRLAMQARQELLDVVFHDLKNPLSAILLSAQLMNARGRKGGDAATAQSAQRIASSAERMKKIIQCVSDLTRIEAGIFALEPKRIRAAQLLAEVASLSRPEAESRSFRMENANEDISFELTCDSERMTQALLSVVDALMDLEGAQPRIQISSRLKGELAEFRIRNPECALPGDQLRHVFDRFWKAQCFRSKGTKLGLTLAKEIIVLHGGRIDVHASPSTGTEFDISLPLH